MWNDCSLSVREHKIKGTGESLPITVRKQQYYSRTGTAGNEN
jgi:hypothetical protein